MLRFFDASLDWLWPWATATVLSGLSRSFELGRGGPGPSSLHFGKLVLHTETLPTTSLHDVLGRRASPPQTSWTNQLGLDGMGAPAGAGTIDAAPRSCLQDAELAQCPLQLVAPVRLRTLAG